MSKTLVVYYSRSGNARKEGQAIAAALGADSKEIVDATNRSGLLGFMRSGFEGMTKRMARIRQAQKDPAAHDLVVVGTPVWAGSLSSPVRAFPAQNGGRFRKVALFLTQGGERADPVFDEMRSRGGHPCHPGGAVVGRRLPSAGSCVRQRPEVAAAQVHLP